MTNQNTKWNANKLVKEGILIIIILFLVLDSGIYTPILKLSQIVFPQVYESVQADVVDIWETEGVAYTRYTTIEYTVDGKKYLSELYFRDSDKEGGVVNVNACKVYPQLVIRDNIGMPTLPEIVLMIMLLQAFRFLFNTRWYEPDKVEKSGKEWKKRAQNEKPELYSFLKKNKSMELLKELLTIQDEYDSDKLKMAGLFVHEKIYEIISETEREWENRHKLDYILIGDTGEKMILYKKDDGFIYSYNKMTFKYTFEAGGLVKYVNKASTIFP